MRIDDMRASEYSSEQIQKMLKSGVSYFSFERLTNGQVYELKKVLERRKENN